jgi:hypothetical protein
MQRNLERMKNIIFIFLLVLLFGCAGQPKKIAETKSGRPEIIIKTDNVDIVKPLLVSKMGDEEEEWSYSLIKKSKYKLTFARPVIAGEEAYKAQEMVGSYYGTVPERFVEFTLTRVDGAIKTVAYPSLLSENGFGQTKQVGLENNIDVFNALQELLNSVKLEIESELSFGLLPQ